MARRPPNRAVPVDCSRWNSQLVFLQLRTTPRTTPLRRKESRRANRSRNDAQESSAKAWWPSDLISPIVIKSRKNDGRHQSSAKTAQVLDPKDRNVPSLRPAPEEARRNAGSCQKPHRKGRDKVRDLPKSERAEVRIEQTAPAIPRRLYTDGEARLHTARFQPNP